jgi:hypothetical protein
MSSFAKSVEPPIGAEGGIDLPPRRDEDPYEALDDLMAAVEILCPVWPPRDAFLAGGNLLL